MERSLHEDVLWKGADTIYNTNMYSHIH